MGALMRQGTVTPKEAAKLFETFKSVQGKGSEIEEAFDLYMSAPSDNAFIQRTEEYLLQAEKKELQRQAKDDEAATERAKKKEDSKMAKKMQDERKAADAKKQAEEDANAKKAKEEEDAAKKRKADAEKREKQVRLNLCVSGVALSLSLSPSRSRS